MAAGSASIADQLDAVVPGFDRLVADARLAGERGRPDLRLEQLEERAQQIAAAIVAPFRGRGARPVNPPLFLDQRLGRAIY